MTEINVVIVNRLRGSASAAIGGMVPIEYSATSLPGLKRSQRLRKHRYDQCSCRNGVLKAIAGLLGLCREMYVSQFAFCKSAKCDCGYLWRTLNYQLPTLTY